MLTPRATRRYRNHPPQVGEIGYLTSGRDRYGSILYWHGLKDRYIVEAYPSNTQARYHLITLRNLRNQQRIVMALQHFTRPEDL